MSTDPLELSLGEYIERNKGAFKPKGKKAFGGSPKKGGNQRNGVKTGRVGKPAAGVKKPGGFGGGANVAKNSAPIVDARLKIIQKTRLKIGDARERLNQRMRQSDARTRITPKATRIIPDKRRMDTIPRRTLQSSPRRLASEQTGYRTASSAALSVGTVSRTVRNGLNRSPILRSGTAYMDRERERSREPDWNSRMQTLPRLEIHVPSVRERQPSSLIHRTHMDFESNSWSRPLKPAPQVVYRSSRDYLKSRLEPARPQEGYRIVVSNLQSTVTHEDIKELFEDVGALLGSRVVRPGTAEVVYKNLEDAVAAVDTYHNRQLDGQPMKCLLVKSSHSSKVGKDIMPDISTVHHALFTK